MFLTFWPVISPTYGSQVPIKIDLILPSFQILDWDCKQHIFLSFRFLCALWFSSTPLECFSTGLRLMTSTFSIENSPLWIIVFFFQVFLHRSTCWQNYILWLIMNNSSTFQKYPFQQIINLIAPHLLADEDSDQLMASHNQVCKQILILCFSYQKIPPPQKKDGQHRVVSRKNQILGGGGKWIKDNLSAVAQINDSLLEKHYFLLFFLDISFICLGVTL